MSSPQPKLYSIIIKAADLQSGTLTLSDGGETDVSFVAAGDWITWTISPDAANIARITAITKKNDASQNLFILGPQEIQGANGPYWFGVAMGQIYTFEDYSISWEDTEGHPHTYDPRIQMNP
ncbi:MAG: hypothetical protein SFV55_15000 [Haliscomenobacter sp.]|uniref:hypothetical protein n=1 Tax=Haliscomenobacter sp. TaxID=2717303 RepID=UPI0029BB3145|nr:hypothetical protein [Haliscomenobacter sp.]MDX2069734.1 hypothetical protein [Haliscomenobacter sp.]